MTTNDIKFPNKKNPYFINELREKVKAHFSSNNISTYGGMQMILKSVFMLSLYFVPYFLMYTGIISTVPGLLICWLMMGLGMSGVGLTIMHDSNHKTFSSNKKVNTFFAKSMYLLGGFPLVWQYQHNTLHHGFTNIEGHDEDIDPGKILRFSPHKPRYSFQKYQYIYFPFFYALSTLSWVTRKEFIQLNRYRKTNARLNTSKSYNRLFTELIASKIIYHVVFLVLPIIFFPFAWYWIVAGFILMHLTCSLLLSLIFGIAHIMPQAEYPLPDEVNTMENGWAIHQLLTTTDFSQKNRLFTWLIGGLNYQIEHHLFPNISHVHYRKISGLVKSTAEKYGLPYHVQSGFFMAVLNHVRMLKLLGR
jgi:linoleoyl-CoA desaturase